MFNNRIFITGLGAITPLGDSLHKTWKNALIGTSGAQTLRHSWVSKYSLPVQFAAEANLPKKYQHDIHMKKLDPASQFALAAAQEAWDDSDLKNKEISSNRLAISFSTGIGGIWTLLNSWDLLRHRGYKKLLPITVPKLMPNSASANLSLYFKACAGAYTCVSACASGSEAIHHGLNLIRTNQADIVITGGTEAAIHPLPIAAFSSMKALSTRNHSPESASRPCDITRDGFVLAEGAGVVILESEMHAHKRNAKIYAELLGSCITSDAYHIASPDLRGMGAYKAIKGALINANIANKKDVAYINLHATSTKLGDKIEYIALKRVMGDYLDNIATSATKSQTGHLLGASGALEAIFTIMSVYTGKIPLTINLNKQDQSIPFNLITNSNNKELYESNSRDKKIIALSNSFGFGGHNSVLVISNYSKNVNENNKNK